jgi:hypothetical protein
MHIEVNEILGAIAIGIGATPVMDLWNLFPKRTFRVPSAIVCSDAGFATCRGALFGTRRGLRR